MSAHGPGAETAKGTDHEQKEGYDLVDRVLHDGLAGKATDEMEANGKEADEEDPFIQELKQECAQEEQAAKEEKENYWEEQLSKVE